MKKFQFKRLAAALAASLLLVSAAGCSGGSGNAPAGDASGSSTPSGEAGSQASGGRTGTLEVWYNGAVEINLEYINTIIDQFKTANPDVTVNISFVPRDELNKQYTMGAVSGQLPDIGTMDGPETAAYIQMGNLVDITDLFNAWDESQYYLEGPLLSCMADGQVYALPQNSNCLGLFYDVDMLAEAGVEAPTTWEELLDAAEKTTKDGRYGLAFSANNNEEGTFQFMPFLLSAGGNINQLDSPEAVKAATLWHDLVSGGFVSRDVINWGQNEVASQFAAGNAAMAVAGPWHIPTIEKDAPDKNWDVCLLPRDQVYASVLGGENMGIMRSCEDVELAWEFLSTYCNGENTAYYCENVARFSPRSDAEQYSDAWSSDPKLKVFNEALASAMPRGPHPRWVEFSGVISTSIQEILTDAKTPEQAMQDAQAAGEKIIVE